MKKYLLPFEDAVRQWVYAVRGHLQNMLATRQAVGQLVRLQQRQVAAATAKTGLRLMVCVLCLLCAVWAVLVVTQRSPSPPSSQAHVAGVAAADSASSMWAKKAVAYAAGVAVSGAASMSTTTSAAPAEASNALDLVLATAYQSNKKPRGLPLPSFMKVDAGEDAFFVVETVKHGNVKFFGVADGVGGWASVGVDSAEFSWELVKQCETAIREDDTIGPKQVLVKGFDKLNKAKVVEYGSSTACILKFDGSNKQEQHLQATNLGDSGFAVVRGGHVVARSKEQQHYFNAPFQLTPINQKTMRDISRLDMPEHADDYSVSLREGDVVVVATDGLFDNIFDHELAKQVTADLGK